MEAHPRKLQFISFVQKHIGLTASVLYYNERQWFTALVAGV